MKNELFAKRANAEKKLKFLLEEIKKVREEIEQINKEMSREYARDFYVKKRE